MSERIIAKSLVEAKGLRPHFRPTVWTRRNLVARQFQLQVLQAIIPPAICLLKHL